MVEILDYRFEAPQGPASFSGPEGSVLVGIVGSGNLEVLLERQDLAGACTAHVETSIRGYEKVWEKVLGDFVRRNTLSNIRISINDGGATPAVVMLRLDQAMADLQEGNP